MVDVAISDELMDAFQSFAEARGIVKQIWNGEITITLYLKDGETNNRELNTKRKSRPPPKLAAHATK